MTTTMTRRRAPRRAGDQALVTVALGYVMVILDVTALTVALLRHGAFARPVLVGLLLNLGFYGLLFVATLYFQRTRGMSPPLAGLALLPMAGMAVVGSTLGGRLMARVGSRVPMVAGASLGVAGFAGWLVAGAHTAYALLVAPMAAGPGRLPAGSAVCALIAAGAFALGAVLAALGSRPGTGANGEPDGARGGYAARRAGWRRGLDRMDQTTRR